jgi:putative addiction module component (TIGR02574 family)
MTRTAETLLRDALTLDDRDRAAIAGLLIDSLETEPEEGVEEAWAVEIDKRAALMDSGQIKNIPWEKVRARLFKKASGTI